jgi:D-glycero-D-manno-heptose 1,7-bisphosphate phosphatase
MDGPINELPAAVLFDRDGTLVENVPYNGDPTLVRPIAGAVRAVWRLRSAGIPIGVITNQSGVARGLIDAAAVTLVNARIDELIGPFDTWQVCPHDTDQGCRCRKPRPGLVEAAAADLEVAINRVAVIGDIGADVDAAEAAGARGILVPSTDTMPDEIAAAAEVAADLDAAVDLLLGQRPAGPAGTCPVRLTPAKTVGVDRVPSRAVAWVGPGRVGRCA